MRIVFVMGPACGGKSTFINKNFSEFKKIDLFDFQTDFMSVEEVAESYKRCMEALLDVIRNNEDVVLEHTFLKAKRRKVYIDAIKQITNVPIEAYFIFPSDEEMIKNARQRGIRLTNTTINGYREIADFPTVDEGFETVTIITKNSD